MFIFFTILASMALSTTYSKTVNKASSPYTNCGCQCSSLPFRDSANIIQCNCKMVDSTGARLLMYWVIQLSLVNYFLLEQPLAEELFLMDLQLFKVVFLLDHLLFKEGLPLDQLVLMLSFLDWEMPVRLRTIIRLLLKEKDRNIK